MAGKIAGGKTGLQNVVSVVLTRAYAYDLLNALLNALGLTPYSKKKKKKKKKKGGGGKKWPSGGGKKPGGGKPHGGKLGFGLWWIKTLMARLGGSVAVESDGQHGTTFRLRLPLGSRA